MPYKRGKFKSTIDSHHMGTSGEKTPAKSSPTERGEQGKPIAHDEKQPEHVTKTHPGETQPHPVTGVHAFHAHHQGGGKYMSHTHHDGGQVETQHHDNHADMTSAMNEALPPEHMGQDSNEQHGGQDWGESLGGITGEGV